MCIFYSPNAHSCELYIVVTASYHTVTSDFTRRTWSLLRNFPRTVRNYRFLNVINASLESCRQSQSHSYSESCSWKSFLCPSLPSSFSSYNERGEERRVLIESRATNRVNQGWAEKFHFLTGLSARSPGPDDNKSIAASEREHRKKRRWSKKERERECTERVKEREREREKSA